MPTDPNEGAPSPAHDAPLPPVAADASYEPDRLPAQEPGSAGAEGEFVEPAVRERDGATPEAASAAPPRPADADAPPADATAVDAAAADAAANDATPEGAAANGAAANGATPDGAVTDDATAGHGVAGDAAADDATADDATADDATADDATADDAAEDDAAEDDAAEDDRTVEGGTTSGFAALGLAEPLLAALRDVGYESPSAIQTRTIPLLLAGRDVLGQAQTGTGKTAAFAVPVLQRLDPKGPRPQALVLTPTRELALQVAEAFQRYAKHLPGFRVLPIYGGQAYPIQLRGLARGVDVVVGTPGRVMDHLRRGSLDLAGVRAVVLDEADEMLRMGFLEDVTWILDQAPAQRQIALFSATLPPEVERIAKAYLNEPERVTVQVQEAEARQIRQRVWFARKTNKLDALTRILEVEEYDALLIFVRTRHQTVELSEKLAARGIPAAPLSGDVPQHLRERTVEKLKGGELDVVVATDVAARGLDVDRISHVVNFDAPVDAESYVHRIGRTGRAGRTGEAILFLAPRERRMLPWLERASKASIEEMDLPSASAINETRVDRFRARICAALEDEEGLALFRGVLGELVEGEDAKDPLDVAAALASLLQGEQPFLVRDRGEWSGRAGGPAATPPGSGASGPHAASAGAPRPGYVPFPEDVEAARAAAQRPPRAPAAHNDLYRLELGYRDRLKPAHVVAVISKVGRLDGREIGNIDIRDAFTFVELPQGMPPRTLAALQTAQLMGRPLGLARYGGETSPGGRPRSGPGKRPQQVLRPQDPARGKVRRAKKERKGW